MFDLLGRRVSTLARGRTVYSGDRAFIVPKEALQASGVYFARATIRHSEGVVAGVSRFLIVR